jgi:hypothetical protein
LVGVVIAIDCARALAYDLQPLATDAVGPSAKGIGDREVSLVWSAPEGCPDETYVKGEIERLLSQSLDRRGIAVNMIVTRDRGVYSLSVDLRSPVGGIRALEHRDCAAVARAAALVIALAIDADAVAVLDERSETPAPSEPPSVERERVSTPPVSRPKEPIRAALESDVADTPVSSVETRSRIAPHVSLGTHVEATLSPNAAWGLLISLGINNAWFLAEVGAAAIPSHVVKLPGSEVGAALEILLVQADVCAGELQGTINVAFCVAAREYWVRATGRGVDEVLEPTALVFSMTAGPLIALRLGDWRLSGIVNGVVPFVRPSFVVDNAEGVVFRPRVVGLSARMALSLTF